MRKKALTLFASTVVALSLFTVNVNAKGASQEKPFLINGKLPHYTGTIKILWDDEELALTKEQKEQLLKVRKNTMSKAKALMQKIKPLEMRIVQASLDEKTPEALDKDVKLLASLRAEATMVHLNCIYQTKKILTKEQMEIVE